MTKCILRRYILKALNRILDERREDVEKATALVSLWTNRAKNVLACLESLSEKLADGKVDDAEVEQAVAELKALVESWR